MGIGSVNGGGSMAAVRPRIDTRHYITTNAVELAPLRVLADQYLKSECHHPDTLRYYSTDLNYLLKFVSQQVVRPVGFLHWADLDRTVLTEFRDERIKLEAPATVSRRVNVIKTFCAWVAKRHRIDNPAERLAQIVLQPGGFKGLREPEYQALKAQAWKADEPVYRFIPLLLAGTGLRCSEAAGLTIGNLSPDHAWLVNVFGKGSKLRCVPLLEDVMSELQIYMFWREQFPTERNSPLLLSPRQAKRGKIKAMDPKSIYNCVRDTGADAGLECHPHMLRHTFAYRWLDAQKEKGIREVQRLALILGHSNIETSLKYLGQGAEELLASIKEMRL